MICTGLVLEPTACTGLEPKPTGCSGLVPKPIGCTGLVPELLTGCTGLFVDADTPGSLTGLEVAVV